MKILIGYGSDILNQSTRAYQVIRETTVGDYVVKPAPIEYFRVDGSKYWAESPMGLMIKAEITNIKEVEI